VALYLDYRLDESYTPSRIAVRAGTAAYDLKEVKTVELEEPRGWVTIPMVEADGG
jgi:anaphase-promoting complex subunit 10